MDVSSVDLVVAGRVFGYQIGSQMLLIPTSKPYSLRLVDVLSPQNGVFLSATMVLIASKDASNSQLQTIFPQIGGLVLYVKYNDLVARRLLILI